MSSKRAWSCRLLTSRVPLGLDLAWSIIPGHDDSFHRAVVCIRMDMGNVLTSHGMELGALLLVELGHWWAGDEWVVTMM